MNAIQILAMQPSASFRMVRIPKPNIGKRCATTQEESAEAL